MRKLLSIFFLCLSFNSGFLTAQNKITISSLKSNYASKDSREKFRQTIESFLNEINPVNNFTVSEKRKIKILRELSLIYSDDPRLKSALKSLLVNSTNHRLLNAAIETSKACFPNEFDYEIGKIAEITKSSKSFAYACLYLVRYPNLINPEKYLSLLKDKFPLWETDQILVKLSESLKFDTLVTPPLIDLMNKKFQRGKTIIYSFQRRNREFSGITVIRSTNGKFLRNADSSIFYVKQLALAVANLPGYLKDGNTPEGIFSITGFYNSTSPSIGPTPILISRLPFEKSPSIYFHNNVSDVQWSEELYSSLLPKSWKNYKPIYETYFAGLFGRRLLVPHGSTDDVNYFSDKSYFPLTPTKGCISSIELWDKNGICTKSDQARFTNGVFSTGNLNGYLIVINIDNKQKNVELEEITNLIESSEAEY